MAQFEGWQVRSYFENVHHQAQESEAKVDGTTRMRRAMGEMIGFPVLAAAEGETPTSRFAPTPNNTPDRSMRFTLPKPYRINLLEDSIDAMEHFWNADSEYVMAAAADRNRERIKRLRAAAEGVAIETTRDTTAAATQTLVSLPAAQTILHGSTGLTKGKIDHARALLASAVGGDVATMGPLHLLYDPLDIRFLFNEATYNTLDSVAMQQLMSGSPVQGLMGFRWIPTNQLSVTGTTRNVVCWARMGVGCGENMDTKMRAGERADLSYAAQVFQEEKYDYVRIDDKLVVIIEVDTTATP